MTKEALMNVSMLQIPQGVSLIVRTGDGRVVGRLVRRSWEGKTSWYITTTGEWPLEAAIEMMKRLEREVEGGK
jgi:hypothetical protein